MIREFPMSFKSAQSAARPNTRNTRKFCSPFRNQQTLRNSQFCSLCAFFHDCFGLPLEAVMISSSETSVIPQENTRALFFCYSPLRNNVQSDLETTIVTHILSADLAYLLCLRTFRLLYLYTGCKWVWPFSLKEWIVTQITAPPELFQGKHWENFSETGLSSWGRPRTRRSTTVSSLSLCEER